MVRISIFEALIGESDDAKSASTSVKTAIGNPIQELYRSIKTTAEKYSYEHPDMYNFQRIAGSAKSRWVDRFGTQLKSDIRRLAENIPPKSARILKAALMERPTTYKQYLGIFAPALMEVGRKINDASLISITKAWLDADNDLAEYVDSLIDDGVDIKASDVDRKPKKDPLPGAQNQQIEQIINDVLSRIPKQYQHQVRMKIAKSDNKLMTMKQELDKLGINL